MSALILNKLCLWRAEKFKVEGEGVDGNLVFSCVVLEGCREESLGEKETTYPVD